MILNDLQIDQFGSLEELTLGPLSDRITVFRGANGCGKTTAVEYLRSMMFGFARIGSSYSRGGAVEGGFVRLRSSEPLQLTRRRRPDGTETHALVNHLTGSPSSATHDQLLPAWVTPDVYREIFTVGYEEAARFDLLTRLCLEQGAFGTADSADIQAAELALGQAIRERDGSGLQDSITNRIAVLQRRRVDLQQELDALRRPDSDLPDRIRRLVLEIDELTDTLSRMDSQLASMDLEIERLQQLIAELRRRNILPSNAAAIEAQIRELTGRLERWTSIRSLIAGEQDDLLPQADSGRQPADGMISIRTIVSRLEDRATALNGQFEADNTGSAGHAEHQRQLRQLREEVAALCAYIRHHEASVSQHEESIELSVVESSLSSAVRMETLLRERIASLRAELARATNVLDRSATPGNCEPCHHRIHEGSVFHGATHTNESLEALELQLQRLQSERARLLASRGSHEETRHGKRALLERLRQQLAEAATLEQIDQLRARISQSNTQIEMLEERRVQLDQVEATLTLVIAKLKLQVDPEILKLASQYVRRLTQDECTEIRGSVSENRLVVQTRHQRQPMTVSQLSRGTRDQVALALRLALIRTRRQRHAHVPLVLDDVFITSDDGRATEVVRLLTEMAAEGQQIIFFTCQQDVTDLFARFGADIRTFGKPAPVAIAPPVAPQPVIPKPVISAPAPAPVVHVVRAPIARIQEEPPARAGHNWLFYLEMDHSIDDLFGITLSESEALQAAGLVEISALLDHSVSDLEAKIRQHGLMISADRLNALRGQAELTCLVPMLRRSDASLLYASGIRSVSDLSQMRPETLFDHITAFQRSESGRRFRRNGRLIDRQQAINWSRWGQYSRSLQEARRSHSRFVSARPERITEESSRQRRARSTRSRLAGLRRGGATTTVSRRKVTGNPETRLRRARRLARRRRSQNRDSQQVDARMHTERHVSQAMSGGGLKFYLTRSSDIEAAPSIGNRTAELLRAIQVFTVDDLLRGTPARTAERLDHRRITDDVVAQWQKQSRLMCEVAQLRGHDAQILVACGIETSEQLQRRSPEELFAIVGPFANTKDGERIVRSSPKPDLAEVTDWINWARQSQSLRAA